MADQEQLGILEQGVRVWNQWRKEHPDIRPNLDKADLRGAVIYIRAKLSRANFSHAYLDGANLSGAKLGQANFSHARLSRADLSSTILSRADLNSALLNHAELAGAILSRANLSFADLEFVNFNFADLDGANLSGAKLAYAVFGDVDLSTVKGLETVKHTGPSTIGIDTIIRSRGKIPEIFLRRAGIPESIIEAIPSLIGSLSPINYYSCFISYSSKDEAFAERLYADLQSNHVRCWFAPEDLKWGDKIRTGIDEAIRIHDKLLLILSGNSVESSWVEKEVETAFDKEAKTHTLFSLSSSP